jgi:hypothetical protein
MRLRKEAVSHCMTLLSGVRQDTKQLPGEKDLEGGGGGVRGGKSVEGVIYLGVWSLRRGFLVVKVGGGSFN